MARIRFVAAFLFMSFLFVSSSFADDEKASTEQNKDKASPREYVTHHKMQVGKVLLSYAAIAGETILTDQNGDQEAAIFSILYYKEGIDHAENRPITFLFNGGPGSSSVWLHLGAFGPRRIALTGDPVNPGGPPYELADNPNALLLYSDLVFADPIGTGHSRALGKGKGKDQDYWGVDEDSGVLAPFIRTYLTVKKRWNSPRYIAGESHGTTCASVLIRDLELELLDSVAFNGVILLSADLDVRMCVGGGPGNELPYVIDLPTYAATAY